MDNALPDAAAAVKPKRYEEMDVLRGLAALTVVFSHFIPYWDRYFASIPVWVPNSFGHNAVLLFFATSGFVIFMTLEKCQSVMDFAALRFSRLYPAYWATLIFSTFITAGVFGGDLWLAGFIANLTMFQEFFGVGNLDNVYWSLTVELAFYLNVAWLLALGLHRYRLTVVATWLVLSCVWALTLYQPEAEQRSLFALFFALDYSPYFSVGIVFYEVVKRGWSASRAALLVLAVFTQFVISGWFEAGKTVAAIVILAFALSGLARFTVSRVTLWLGTISYSLYLVHRNVGYRTLDWLHDQHIGPWTGITATIALVLALASVFTYLVERPTQLKLRAAYRQWRDKT